MNRKFYTCDKPAMLVSAKLVLQNSAWKMFFWGFLSLDVGIVIICFTGFCDRYGLYVYVMHVCNFL
jgi:uncharacterized membrane protein HdeD (DUF308 family)